MGGGWGGGRCPSVREAVVIEGRWRIDLATEEEVYDGRAGGGATADEGSSSRRGSRSRMGGMEVDVRLREGL
jgi:hypothetical protein